MQFLSGFSGPLANPSGCSLDAPLLVTCIMHLIPAPCVVTFTTLPSEEVTYPAGWNLVALPSALAPAGSYYTLQAGDAEYEMVSADRLRVGEGYWRYFEAPRTIDLGQVPAATSPITVQVPAGQFVMIGNPFATAVSISLPGPDDVASIYDPSAGYRHAKVLAPGQGAFVYSFVGGTLTLSPQ